MLRLELNAITATLENFNTRTEKNGPDKSPAADLKISCMRDAGVLAEFSPTLKAFLFADGGKDLAGDVPLALREPHLKYPLQRDEEMTGAKLVMDYGVKDKMEFDDAKVNQFSITPMEGGSVLLGFRVQCKPTEKQAGRLYMLQEQAVTITLVAGELPTMGDSK